MPLPSYMTLRAVFGPCSLPCRGLEITELLQDKYVSRASNPKFGDKASAQNKICNTDVQT